MRLLGGHDCDSAVRLVWHRIVSKNLGVLLNWSGYNYKGRVKDSNLTKVLIGEYQHRR